MGQLCFFRIEFLFSLSCLIFQGSYQALMLSTCNKIPVLHKHTANQ